MRRKIFAVIICLALLMTGCGGAGQENGASADSDVRTVIDADEAEAERNGEEPGETDVADAGESASGAEQSATAPKAAPTIKIDTDVVCERESENADEFSITAKYDVLSVENDGYEDLNAALEELNERVQEEFYWLYEDNLEYFREMWDEMGQESREYYRFEMTYKANVVRADENVVSVRYEEYFNLGGAHPSWYTETRNLNAQTGDTLQLPDIFEEDGYDRAYDTLIAELEAVKDERGLEDSYEETVNALFYGDGEPVWCYGEETLQFVFDPYILAPFASGTIEVEIPLEDLKLAEIGGDDGTDGGMREVYVSTAGELMNAIANNTRIYLAPGVYDLTQWVGDGEAPKNGRVTVEWENVRIKRTSNLQLVAQRPELPTQIVVQYSYEDVLKFDHCRNILLEGLVMGHAVEPGSCSGDVLEFSNCMDVTLRRMNLYGCGAYGITAYGCKRFNTEESWIHDCTYGMVYITGSEQMVFRDTWFTYCKEYTLLDGNSSQLFFENCTFDKNWADSFVADPANSDIPTQYTFTGCKFLSYEDEWPGTDSGYVTIR